MNKIISIFSIFLCFSLEVNAYTIGAQTDLPRVNLESRNQIFEVQVATTPLQIALGLMFRKQMPDNEGMLFVFPEKKQHCFWMKNTLIPLTVAFISDKGEILSKINMMPLSLDQHCANQPVRFVLEMNQEWFVKNEVRVGDKISGNIVPSDDK